MKYVGWVAAGGLGIGIVASALLAVASPDDDHGLNWNRLLSSSDDCYDSNAADTKEPERHLAWDGEDSVTIAAPATVHYRASEGNEVIVRGASALVGHLRVHDGVIDMSCHNNFTSGDLDITLPGRTFREVALEGSPRLVMENLNQPELELSIRGSGSVRLSGSVEHVETSIGGSGKVTFADLAMKQLKVDVSGSGHVDGKGSSNSVEVSVSGSGGAELADIPMKEISIAISGSGGVDAAPQDQAEISIKGSGDVTLLTHPGRISTSIKGSGRLVQLPSQAAKGT